MTDTPGFNYDAILQASPVVLGMTESSPEGVFSRLFDALVVAGSLPADLRETARAAVRIYFHLLTKGGRLLRQRSYFLQNHIGIHLSRQANWTWLLEMQL